MAVDFLMDKGYCSPGINNLDEITKHDPSKLRTIEGMLAALDSPRNTATVDEDFWTNKLRRRDGMIRYERVTYRSRTDNSEFGEPERCVFGDETFKKEVLLSASTGIYNKEKITEDQIRHFCSAELVNVDLDNMSGKQLRMLKDVYDIFDRLFEPLRRKMDATLIAQFGLAAGLNIGSGGSNDWWDTTAGGKPVFNGISETELDFGIMQMNNPILVGDGNLARFMGAIKAMCCNDGGVDAGVMAQGAFAWYRDFAMSGILGANKFAAWDAGVMQLATANFKSKPFTTVQAGDLVAEGLIRDPMFPSISYDVELRVDTCTGNLKTYNLLAQIHFDLFAQPIDGFDVGDPLAGTNFAFIGEATAL